MFLTARSALPTSADGQLTVHLEPDGVYRVSVNKQRWLTSGPTFFRANGRLCSTSDGSLKQIGEPRDISGQDTLGPWRGQTLSYTAAGANVSVSLRTYDVIAGKLAVFTQVCVKLKTPHCCLCMFCGRRLSLAVTSLIASTQLFDVEPG